MTQVLSIEAIYENGVFRPAKPLALISPQAVTLIVQFEEKQKKSVWPSDVAEIYQELAEEDRRLAEGMLNSVRETWPSQEEQP